MSHLTAAVPASVQRLPEDHLDTNSQDQYLRISIEKSQADRNISSVRGPVAPEVTMKRPRRTLVLCFDGTGNQFHGDSSDSNILKIFRMLDRSSGKGFHYYQPGIGTYVAADSLGAKGSIQKMKNWYYKAKDSAVGTSFDEHVVGGYKFLMQFYSPGDNIYMFGFSRGSYTVRFLAEMIDWVGLITHGNEEMIAFAWKTFSKWKAIDMSESGARERERKAYHFMVSFRETFSRPVRRIRFLGLFDTVNSVPRFESAVFSRRRMPFSAVSSAKTIRHAVSIDERRAKFRADLVSHGLAHKKDAKKKAEEAVANNDPHHHDWILNSARYSHKKPQRKPEAKKDDMLSVGGRGRTGMLEKALERETSRYRSHSRSRSHLTADRRSNASHADRPDGVSIGDNASFMAPRGSWDDDDDDSSDEDEENQDIEELWFPGGHADIGGGWENELNETPLSHVPLVWIVHEARKAGLELDEEKMANLDCLDNYDEKVKAANLPKFELSTSAGEEVDLNNAGESKSNVEALLIDTASKGRIHDCLRYKEGLPWGSVLRWQIMEWMPFRRLDLGEDGTWKPIRWPLPRGEVRDMPEDAKVHNSAIRRMKTVPNYRPGNLILGGGGRGVIIAPESAGTGDWEICANEGDVVRESVKRKPKVTEEKKKHHANGGQNGKSEKL